MVGKFFLVDFVVVAVLRHSRFWAWVSWRTINLNSIYSPACLQNTPLFDEGGAETIAGHWET